jgi:hypothetical protein
MDKAEQREFLILPEFQDVQGHISNRFNSVIEAGAR